MKTYKILMRVKCDNCNYSESFTFHASLPQIASVKVFLSCNSSGASRKLTSLEFLRENLIMRYVDRLHQKDSSVHYVRFGSPRIDFNSDVLSKRLLTMFFDFDFLFVDCDLRCDRVCTGLLIARVFKFEEV